jgi:hypothetical protein
VHGSKRCSGSRLKAPPQALVNSYGFSSSGQHIRLFRLWALVTVRAIQARVNRL